MACNIFVYNPGGMKIWECTFDLASYLTSIEKPINLENKSVLDLGCGAGVLGLVALKLGAEVVHFQDYVGLYFLELI